MWSLPASLGVGHFTVPPDVADRCEGVPEPHSTVRTLVVPHDIIPVKRTSPIKARKRTPWNPAQQPHRAVERGGSREWFADRLFVEPKSAHLPAACSTSAMVHVVLLILVLLLLAARAARADLTPRRLTDVSLRMPAMESFMPVTVAPPITPAPMARPSQAPPPRPAPPPARTLEASAAAPLETPSSIEAEPPTFDAPPARARRLEPMT